MSETWWTEEAVEALHAAGAYCGTCDYEDWGERRKCPECVKCLQGYLTALTPHVEAYAASFQHIVAATDAARAEAFEELESSLKAVRRDAFEEAKRIVAATILWVDRDKGIVIAALDRAMQAAPTTEAT